MRSDQTIVDEGDNSPSKAIRPGHPIVQAHWSPHLLSAGLFEQLLGVKGSVPLGHVGNGGEDASPRVELDGRGHVITGAQAVVVPIVSLSEIRDSSLHGGHSRPHHAERLKYSLAQKIAIRP